MAGGSRGRNKAPDKNGKGGADPELAPEHAPEGSTSGAAPKPVRSKKKTPAEKIIDFTPFLRKSIEFANWRTSPAALNFQVTYTPKRTDESDDVEIRKRSAMWHELGLPVGLQVLHRWDTEPKNISELSAYIGFDEKATVNFVDTVVCDIIQEGLMLIAHKCTNKKARELWNDETIRKATEDTAERAVDGIKQLHNKINSRLPSIEQSDIPLQLISPAELIRLFTTDFHLRTIVNTVSALHKPMFLPITPRTLSYTEDLGDDFISVAATVLVHAVQILLFAPTKWDKEIEYSQRPHSC